MERIKLKFTHVRLLISDVKACLHFYRDVPGFEVLWADEEGNYVSFKTWEVVLALNRQDSMAAVVGTAYKPPSAERDFYYMHFCQPKRAVKQQGGI